MTRENRVLVERHHGIPIYFDRMRDRFVVCDPIRSECPYRSLNTARRAARQLVDVTPKEIGLRVVFRPLWRDPWRMGTVVYSGRCMIIRDDEGNLHDKRWGHDVIEADDEGKLYAIKKAERELELAKERYAKLTKDVPRSLEKLDKMAKNQRRRIRRRESKK